MYAKHLTLRSSTSKYIYEAIFKVFGVKMVIYGNIQYIGLFMRYFYRFLNKIVVKHTNDALKMAIIQVKYGCLCLYFRNFDEEYQCINMSYIWINILTKLIILVDFVSCLMYNIIRNRLGEKTWNLLTLKYLTVQRAYILSGTDRALGI